MLTLLLLAQAATAAMETPEARGFRAAGARPSGEPAIRAAGDAPPGFALGASLAGWRNAAASVAYDASHTTGDGGDAELLAEDCSDERIAFFALKARLVGAGVTFGAVAAAAGLATDVAASWTKRLTAAPAQCR